MFGRQILAFFIGLLEPVDCEKTGIAPSYPSVLIDKKRLRYRSYFKMKLTTVRVFGVAYALRSRIIETIIREARVRMGLLMCKIWRVW